MDNDDGALTIPEFKAQEKLGHTKTYELINSGAIDAYKVGSKTLITKSSVRRWRASLPRISASSAQRSEAA
jgi:excisionase family DNA binding protein